MRITRAEPQNYNQLQYNDTLKMIRGPNEVDEVS